MNNKLGNDAANLTISKIITLTVSLVSSMLLSRVRTLDEYGTYSQLLIVTTLAISIFTFGLPNSTNYFLARAESSEGRRDFLSVYYSLSTVLCIIMGIAMAFAVPVIESYFDNQAIRAFTYFLAVFPWTSVTISSISNVLVVYGKTRKLMLVNVVNSLVALAAILIVQFFNGTFSEYMLLFLCGQCGVSVWVYIIVNHLGERLSFSFDFRLIKAIMTYSVPIGLATIVGTISIEIDKLMIGYFLNTESVAIYTNAGRELPLTIVASSLTAVLLPQMASRLKRNDVDGTVALWGYSIRMSYIIICFCATACVVFAPQIITVLYSEKYLPGIEIFRIYSLVLLLRTTYFGIVLNSLGKTRLIFYCSLLTLGLNAILNFTFYKAFGFTGPALATFISIAVIQILQLLFTARELHFPFRKLFPWKGLIIITAVNAAWGCAASIVIRLLHWGTDSRSVVICICFGMVITLLYTIAEKKQVIQLWRSLNQTEPAYTGNPSEETD